VNLSIKLKKLKGLLEVKNTYVQGSFGFPMNEENKRYFLTEYDNDYNFDNPNCISKASADTFGFDCVCLIKAVFWGWTGDLNDNMVVPNIIKITNMMLIKLSRFAILLLTFPTSFQVKSFGCIIMLVSILVNIDTNMIIRWSTDPDGCGQIHISKLENNGEKGEKSRKWDLQGKLPFIKK